MDYSLRRTDSSLSISSIISDCCPHNNDNLDTTKKSPMLKLLLEAVSNTNAENTTLGNEILDILNTIKFDIKSLPTDLREGMHTITAILKSEGLNTVDESMLQLCLEKKKIENKMKERQERLLKVKYNAAFAKYNVLQEKLNHISNEIEQVENAWQSKISNDENMMSDKVLWSIRLRDYKEAIGKLEQEFDTLQIQDISLDNILEKSKLLLNKMNNLSELNTSLERYSDLPPNLLQARNALEFKKRELEEIECLINEKMNV